jgi:hypothetical protein
LPDFVSAADELLLVGIGADNPMDDRTGYAYGKISFTFAFHIRVTKPLLHGP